MLLSGEAGVMHLTARGVPEPDDTFLVLMNAAESAVPFTLPNAHWWCVFDTTAADTEPSVDPDEDTDLGRIARYDVGPRSLALLRRNGGAA